MKKACIILLTILIISPVFSQEKEHRKGSKKERHERRNRLEKLTPDQIATLQTKKMAIALDLNENQKKELLKLNTQLAVERKEKREDLKAKREKGEKFTQEERYTLANERLDKEYAVLQEMKKILNEDQLQQWKKHKGKRQHLRKKRVQQHRKKNRQ